MYTILMLALIIHIVCFFYFVFNYYKTIRQRDGVIKRMLSYFKDKHKNSQDITLKEDYEDIIDEIEMNLEEWHYRENM